MKQNKAKTKTKTKTYIHPTAIVEEGAVFGEGVFVGPYCTVGPKVSIGKGTRLISHVVLAGRTTIGEDNVVYPFASLGQPSPDLKYKGEDAALVVGNRNDIREYVTMHIGTAVGKGETRVGDDNLLMPLTHIAHDCIVANNCIFANGTHLAGHVEVANNAIIGGLSGIHQYVRIGAYAIVGGHTGVDKDVPPFGNVYGKRAHLGGLNLIGLRRRKMEKKTIQALKKAYDVLFMEDSDLPLSARVDDLAERDDVAEVLDLLEFVKTAQRGITPAEGK